MTRVAITQKAVGRTLEPIPPRSPLAGNSFLSATSFEKHLEQARQAASAASGSLSAKSGNAPSPAPPPKNSATQPPSTSDGPPKNSENRDAPSPRPHSNPDAEAAPTVPQRPDESHREDEQDADAPAAATEPTVTSVTVVAGEREETSAPPLAVEAGVDAVGVARAPSTTPPAAIKKTPAATTQQPHALGNLEATPESFVGDQPAGATTALSKAAQNVESTDLTLEDHDDQTWPSDASLRGKSHQVASHGPTSTVFSGTEVPGQGQTPAGAELPPIELVGKTSSAASPSQATINTGDRPAENAALRPGDRRTAKAFSTGASGRLQQPQTEERSDLPNVAAAQAESETVQLGVQTAQREPQLRGGEATDDRPTEAKTVESALNRGTSPKEAEAVSRREERGTPEDGSDRVRFVQRVARAFESAAERGGHVRLRLHPPELGTLRLELTVRNGQMVARLETETEAARNLLVDHLPELKERLASHQIRVERFDVEWHGQPHGELPRGFGEPGRWQGSPPGRGGREPEPASTQQNVNPLDNVARRPPAQTNFDVVI